MVTKIQYGIEYAVSELRWFFGQTVVWIWGHNLLTAAHLSGVKMMKCYGLRVGRVAFYVVRIGKTEV